MSTDILHDAPHRVQAEPSFQKRPKRSPLALELYALVAKIIAFSPDFSCFASERKLARHLHRRVESVAAAKRELIDGGWLDLTLRNNRHRQNPRHRLTLPAPKKRERSQYNAFLKSRTPDLDCNSCGFRPLMALDLWHTMPKLDLIDCYLKSGMNVCPLRAFGKVPTVSRGTWCKKTREQKIDHFYYNDDLNVGLWLGTDRTIFDFDSGRPVEHETLIARRGERHHLYFQGHEEIYNTAKDVAPDIDTRAVGGLIVLPPSVHESGDLYEWETALEPVPVPDELLALWFSRNSSGRATGFKLGDLPAEILKGARDNTLWSYGRRLKASGVIFDELDVRLRIINQERCKPAFSDRYMAMKIRHIWTHWNDEERFISHAQ